MQITMEKMIIFIGYPMENLGVLTNGDFINVLIGVLMTNYTFNFKSYEDIKNKFKTISVDAKDKKEVKKKLLQELKKVNADTIDVIELEKYRYKKFENINWRVLIEELQLISDFYPTEPDDADAFVDKVDEVVAYLQKDIVYD